MTANPLSNVPPIGPASNVGPPNASGRFKPVDPLKLLRQHMRTLIVALILGVMLGVGVWALLRIYEPQFSSNAQLAVKSAPNPDKLLQSGDAGGRDVLDRYMETQVQQIKFDKVMEQALSKNNVRQTQWFEQFDGDLRAARKALQENVIAVSVSRGTNLLNLRATTGNEKDPPELLTAVIGAYLAELEVDVKKKSREMRKLFLDEQDRAANKLSRLEEDLAQFTRNNDLDTLSGRSSSARLEYESLSRQRLQLEYTLSEAKASYQSLVASQMGNADPPSDLVSAVKALPEFQRRRQTISQLKSEYEARLQGDYGPEHRSMRNMKQRIHAKEASKKRALNRRIQERLSARVTSAAQMVENLKSQLAALAPQINAARTRMTDLTAKLERHSQLEDELKAARDNREKAQNELTKLRVSMGHPDAVRVDTSSAPSDAELSSPLPQVIVPAMTLLTLGLVGGFLFLREMLDQRLRSPADVKMLSNATLLGMLPDTSEDPAASRKVERIVERQPAGLMAESYRQVRTALLSRMDRRGYKTLMIVAARPGSGNTATTHNLACSLALNGRRVLVVDANFRRPGQAELADQPNEMGLAEVLKDGEDPAKVIQWNEETGVAVLTAGQSRDAAPELLEGRAFRTMLGQLEADYDMILIDAPPALLSSESQLLAKQVDAIALLGRAGRDQRGMIERMAGQLDGHRADILGLILNGVRSSAGGYFRKSYREFYRYSQDRTKPAARRDSDRPPRQAQAQAQALEAVDHHESGNGQAVADSDNGHPPHGNADHDQTFSSDR